MKIKNNILERVYNKDIVNGTIIIPDSVTTIGDGAFLGCSDLTNITIGRGVTSIGEGAFENCSGLTNVTIGSGVTNIGEYVFYDCIRLTSITIPDSVKSIGKGAFYWCRGLENITVDSDNVVYHSEGNCLIETATKTLIVGCKNSVIPDDGSVTRIGDGAFRGCSGLTSITIPDSVTSIGDKAFSSCIGLTSITIPDNVTNIEIGVFSGCNGLTSVTIGSGVTRIGCSAFHKCNKLTTKTKAYKAFKITTRGNFRCLNKTYNPGKLHYVKEDIELCTNGIHYCTNLFEIFNYYSGEIDKDIAIFEIEPGSKILESETSKCCTNSCRLVKRLYRENIINILNGKE